MADVRTLPVGEDDEARVTLDDLAREGARRMIAAALEAEVDDYVSSFVDEVGEDGKRLVVRNGRARERRVTVGSGTVPIKAPRVNDRRVDEETGERKRFSSRILPAYARRSPKVTEVLPILYLHGLSTGDFGPALRDLLGEDASGLSSSSIQRLTEQWQAEHAAFRTRELRVSSLLLPVRGRGQRQRAPRRGPETVPAGRDRRARGRGEGAVGGRGRLPRVRGLLECGVP
jgi:putative transposase